MKGTFQHSLLILIISVIVVLARPCFVSASQAPNSPFNHKTTSLNLRQVVRKRNEYTYSQEECTALDDIRKNISSISNNSSFSFLQKLPLGLLIRSCLFSRTGFLFKKRATVFQVCPHNDHYVNLSVFRI